MGPAQLWALWIGTWAPCPAAVVTYRSHTPRETVVVWACPTAPAPIVWRLPVPALSLAVCDSRSQTTPSAPAEARPC